MDDYTKGLLILNNISGLGPIRKRRLLELFGSIDAILGASQEHLASVPGIGPQLSQSIVSWERQEHWRSDLELVERWEVNLLHDRSPDYPLLLKSLPDRPTLLYVLGKLPGDDTPTVAIVGTRNATIYGKESAHTLAKELAHNSVTVVSGLARGIDTAAHRGCLEGRGTTIAVIGCGLTQLYPPENRPLAKTIVSSGAVISEYPMATNPDRKLFPQRNRIVSGLSSGVLLVEAPQRSGAMLTMHLAKKQGKRLFALPGRIDQPNYRGNHQLIKEGDTELVESSRELLEKLDLPSAAPSPQPSAASLSNEEQALLEMLPSEEVAIDAIVVATSMSIVKLHPLLMRLVLKRRVREYPGKVYKKVC